jgi:type I restriction enzyme S subunit
MRDEWKKIKLGDICRTNLNSYSPSEGWTFINYLDTGNITQGKIDEIQCLSVGTDTIPSRARRKVCLDDIIYSTVRPNQRHYGIIKNLLPNMLVSTGFAVISTDKLKANSRYIYYYLMQDDIVDTLHALAEQSTSAYPSIKPSDIEDLEISLPTLSEQEAIADTLSVLDNKIDLNCKINDYLAA